MPGNFYFRSIDKRFLLVFIVNFLHFKFYQLVVPRGIQICLHYQESKLEHKLELEFFFCPPWWRGVCHQTILQSLSVRQYSPGQASLDNLPICSKKYQSMMSLFSSSSSPWFIMSLSWDQFLSDPLWLVAPTTMPACIVTNVTKCPFWTVLSFVSSKMENFILYTFWKSMMNSIVL